MSYPVGKYIVTLGAFGTANGGKWSGNWSISGPNWFGGMDPVEDGRVDGPFSTHALAIEAARVAGVARAKELEDKDNEG